MNMWRQGAYNPPPAPAAPSATATAVITAAATATAAAGITSMRHRQQAATMHVITFRGGAPHVT